MAYCHRYFEFTDWKKAIEFGIEYVLGENALFNEKGDKNIKRAELMKKLKNKYHDQIEYYSN